MRHQTETLRERDYTIGKNDQVDSAVAQDLSHAYELAVIEFNLATVPLLAALLAHSQPTAAEVVREETARATVSAARLKVWARLASTKAPPLTLVRVER